jgi:cytochrome b561
MLAQTRYTRTAIALHWLIAAAHGVNIALILLVDHYPDDWVRPAVDTHKSIGITVLGLVLLRILWLPRTGRRPCRARSARWSASPPMRPTARCMC